MAEQQSIIEQFNSSNTIESGQKAVVKYKIPNTDSSITLLGDEKDIAKLKQLIDRSAKSDFARDGMEIAGKGGYTVEFIHAEGKGGGCEKDSKSITLSPHIQDNNLLCIFAHETRHAGQFERGLDEEFGFETIKSSIIKTRSAEADAEAAAAKVCYELAKNGNSLPLSAMRRRSPNIVNPFEKAATEKGGVESGKAQTEAFKGWYDNDNLKHSYEESYEITDMTKALREGTSGDRTYSEVITGKKITELVCWNGKKGNYFTDNPKILENGKYLDVDKTTLTFFKDYFKKREEKTGKAPDKSIEKLPVRGSYENMQAIMMAKQKAR